MTDDPEMTLNEMIRAMWPILSPEERETVVTAERKLNVIDTFGHSPAGNSATNYHGEAYAALRQLAEKLISQHGGDSVVRQFHDAYAR